MPDRQSREWVVRTATPPRLSLRAHGPQQIFMTLWTQRKLIYRLAKREVASRYRVSDVSAFGTN